MGNIGEGNDVWWAVLRANSRRKKEKKEKKEDGFDQYRCKIEERGTVPAFRRYQSP